MTGFKRFGFFLLCTAFALLILPLQGAAQSQEMTYEDYKVKLAEYEKRTVDAKRALAECKQAMEQLGQEGTDLDSQIDATNQEIYRLVGVTDQSGIDSFLAELGQIESRLMGLLSLSDEALFDKREEVDGIDARMEELRADKRALLPKAQTKIRSIDQLLQRVKDRMPRKRIKQYTVLRNDSLWKIAKKPDIYNDAYMWPRIYVENRGLIKDPDLIYPNSILNVPFGVDLNQHLVLQGQNLSAIAGSVYKDITKWHKIYQANKAQILDPNLIFPAQVFDIPAN